MAYLIGGLLSLVFAGIYFMLVAVMWCVAAIVTVVGSLVVAILDHYADTEPKTNKGNKK